MTENAVTISKGLLTTAGQPDHGRLRIGVKSGADLGVQIAAAPMPHDDVIEDSGAQVFLDPVASPQIARRELDVVLGDSLDEGTAIPQDVVSA